MMPASLALEAFPFDQIFVASSKIDTEGRTTNLQQDFNNCPIFALDHAFQLSKLNIYHKLKGSNFYQNLNTVNWEQLPITLVWNAQSLKFLNKFLTENEKILTKYELEEYSKYLTQHRTKKGSAI